MPRHGVGLVSPTARPAGPRLVFSFVFFVSVPGGFLDFKSSLLLCIRVPESLPCRQILAVIYVREMAADTFSRVPTRAVPRAALSEVKAETLKTLAKAETRHSWQEFAMAKKKN
jgi:hypothetical protein